LNNTTNRLKKAKEARMHITQIYIPLGSERIKGSKIAEVFDQLPVLLNKEFSEYLWSLTDKCVDSFTFKPGVGLEELRFPLIIKCENVLPQFSVKLPAVDPDCYYYEISLYVSARIAGRDFPLYNSGYYWEEGSKICVMVAGQIMQALGLIKS
jgi:hypothetical protein